MMGKKNLVNFSLSSLRNCKLEQYASEVRKRYFGEVSQTRILEQIPRLECCNLSSRGVLLISGTDAYSFLQVKRKTNMACGRTRIHILNELYISGTCYK